MSMTNMNTNTGVTMSVTMLTVCGLIDGKEVLLQAFRNEEVMTGVLMGWMHVEP